MKKRWLDALERIWVDEIDDRLPLQSKAKVFRELESEGLVQTWTRNFGVDRFGEISVTGWALTHAGRFLYCSNCEEPNENGAGVVSSAVVS